MKAADRSTNLKGGAGLGLLFAFILGMIAWQRASHLSVLESPPERMTLRELLDSPGGKRRHVLLSDFVFAEGYAYMESSNLYSGVYLPIFPVDGVNEGKILAVVESWDLSTEDSVRALQQQEEVEGICSAHPSGMGVTVGPLLEEAVPGTSIEYAWRIQYFHTRPTWNGVWSIMAGVAACLVIASVCIFSLKKGKPSMPPSLG